MAPGAAVLRTRLWLTVLLDRRAADGPLGNSLKLADGPVPTILLYRGRRLERAQPGHFPFVTSRRRCRRPNNIAPKLPRLPQRSSASEVSLKSLKSLMKSLKVSYEVSYLKSLMDLTLKFSIPALIENEVLGSSSMEARLAGYIDGLPQFIGRDHLGIVPQGVPEPAALVLLVLALAGVTRLNRQ